MTKGEPNSNEKFKGVQTAAIILIPIGVIAKPEWLSTTILLLSVITLIVTMILAHRSSRRHRT